MGLLDRVARRLGYVPRTRAFWDGAQVSRLTADWIFKPVKNADEELKADLWKLRQRARDLARNDPLFAHVLDVLTDNVVGSSGIAVEPRVWTTRGQLNAGLNEAIEDAFLRWGRRCTLDGRSSWTDVQALVVRTWAMDGEAFVELVPTRDNPWGLALRVLDPDLIDVTYNVEATRSRNAIVMGVELDARGAPVAYHTRADIPGRARMRLPAETILHIYRPQRPGQTRGVTLFAPVMMAARHLAGYREAELVAARTAAAKMGFLVPSDTAVVDDQDASTVPMEAAPGTIERLPAGLTFQAWDPQHPTTAFGDFTKSILRQIAAGMGLSYVTLVNDLEATSYSSIRAGLLAERDRYRVLQQWLIGQLCRPVYEAWLARAYMAGAISLPTPRVAEHTDAQWLPRGWAWVDPEKDVAAAREALALGLTSRTALCAEQGRDFEDNLIALQREAALMAQYGFRPEEDTTDGTEGAPADDPAADGDDQSSLAA